MIYLRWGASDIKGLHDLGLDAVVTECSANGVVLREVGLDRSGCAVHRAPDPAAEFFLFELQRVRLASSSDISGEEFSDLWQAAAARPNNSFKPKPLRGSA